MKRSILSAILLGGMVVSAQAADLTLDSAKDALPAIPDGPITWNGVTFYGTVDVGYAYVNNGANPSGSFYNGAAYTTLAGKFINRNVSTLNNNALQLSNVGIKIEENIGYGFQAIGKLETQFNPISGELGDACDSLLRNSGKSLYVQENNADGSRCGQAFANAAYGGLSHPMFGTLTIGRQTSLVQDGMGSYDPMMGSAAFSAIGYSGSVGGGTGNTETTRWDNSIKYILTYGPVHAAGMYTNGGQDTPIMNDAYAANVGITYMGFSLDGFYTQENGAVSLAGIPLATNGILNTAAVPGTLGTVVTGCNAALGNCPNYLSGTVVNNEAWDIMAKYVFNVPSFFGAPAVSTKDAPCGGMKDEPCAPPMAKVTITGGYQHVDQSNPDHPQYYYSGDTTIGGYQFVSTAIRAFGSDRTRETAWAGVRYEDGPWTLAAAYYYYGQNSFLNASYETCAATTAAAVRSATWVGARVGSNCSGDFNQGSFLIDYAFTRHLDVYGGVTFTDQTGGFNSGFLADNTFAFATGVRIKW